MRPRLFFSFLLIVLVPLVSLAWLGYKIARDEREVAQHEVRRLLEGRLADLRANITRTIEDEEARLVELLQDVDDRPDDARGLVRRSPELRQVFLLAPDGRLMLPPSDASRSTEEADFVRRTASIWSRDAVLYVPPEPESMSRNVSKMPGLSQRRSAPEPPRGGGDNLIDIAKGRSHGWIAWHWEEGLHLLFWSAHSNGVVGAEIERVIFLSRIIAKLPLADVHAGRVVLVDSRGERIYQLGDYEVPAGQAPVAELPLDYPLDSWRLQYFVPPEGYFAIHGASVTFNVLAGLGAVLLALISLAVYFYRESSREMREAAQRVDFVTQVSHELKTPLTNIRLYAELLENDLEGDEAATKRAGVIISESQRLARLIDNVLAFSRHRRGMLASKLETIVVDDVVRQVIEQFRPALAAKGVRVELVAEAPAALRADGDALGQILANLVSNVEKYGSSGGLLRIATAQEADRTVISVADDGPGISKQHRRRIFRPFYRVSDKLTDGVTGTGIGLTIAKDLAELNGGSLNLVDSERGACFRLELRHPKQEERAP